MDKAKGARERRTSLVHAFVSCGNAFNREHLIVADILPHEHKMLTIRIQDRRRNEVKVYGDLTNQDKRRD